VLLITEVWLYIFYTIKCRAVPESGSGSGRNPAIFVNPVEIRLRPKFGRSRIWFAGFVWQWTEIEKNNIELNFQLLKLNVIEFW